MNTYDLECAFLRAAARAQLRADGMKINSAAREVGVARETLSRVLHGHRQSRALCRKLLVFTAPKGGEA